MIITCAPGGLVIPERPVQGLNDISQAGFANVLINMRHFCPPGELEGFGEQRRDAKKPPTPKVSENPELLAKRAASWAGSCRETLGISIAYAPVLSRATKRTDLNGLLERLALESIQACAAVGCKAIVIRPLFSGVAPKSEWEVNRPYYLSLAEAARRGGVTILLENQCRDLNGHLIRGACSDAYEAAEWIDALNAEAGEERFGFCLDVGACSLCGQNMHDFVRTVGSRLKAVILRDCDGRSEASLLPFTSARRGRSQTDWLGLIRGLRETEFDGVLILSMEDTAAAFSPLLRPGLLSLAKSVAEYFRWQIEIERTLKEHSRIVLFGAGNMCRNYMKCYGEAFPPLFTCDNNPALWGSEFCGLEVRPPEALLDIPADCAVLICNTYYREIERQLRDMGVRNIAYFNDEYMPSFHFDRIER